MKLTRIISCIIILQLFVGCSSIRNNAGGDAYSVDKVSRDSAIRFGLIADIQYCDCDAHGSRYYRNSLQKLEECVGTFNKEKVQFTINVGDLVDRDTPKNLDSVLVRLDKLDATVYNIAGNHDYGNVQNNRELYQSLKMPGAYYAFSQGDWHFILLNTNELAEYSTKTGSAQRQQWQVLNQGLKSAQRKNGQSWNGGVSTEQLQWMEKQLRHAQAKSKNVIIFTHHPLFPENGLEALNNRDILHIIEKYPQIKAVISGHHHPGNFDTYKGIPMITLEGMIETSDQNSYGILELYPHHLNLRGRGRMTSRELQF